MLKVFSRLIKQTELLPPDWESTAPSVHAWTVFKQQTLPHRHHHRHYETHTVESQTCDLGQD